jgi:hypothetical protein
MYGPGLCDNCQPQVHNSKTGGTNGDQVNPSLLRSIKEGLQREHAIGTDITLLALMERPIKIEGDGVQPSGLDFLK